MRELVQRAAHRHPPASPRGSSSPCGLRRSGCRVSVGSCWASSRPGRAVDSCLLAVGSTRAMQRHSGESQKLRLRTSSSWWMVGTAGCSGVSGLSPNSTPPHSVAGLHPRAVAYIRSRLLLAGGVLGWWSIDTRHESAVPRRGRRGRSQLRQTIGRGPENSRRECSWSLRIMSVTSVTGLYGRRHRQQRRSPELRGGEGFPHEHRFGRRSTVDRPDSQASVRPRPTDRRAHGAGGGPSRPGLRTVAGGRGGAPSTGLDWIGDGAPVTS